MNNDIVYLVDWVKKVNTEEYHDREFDVYPCNERLANCSDKKFLDVIKSGYDINKIVTYDNDCFSLLDTLTNKMMFDKIKLLCDFCPEIIYLKDRNGQNCFFKFRFYWVYNECYEKLSQIILLLLEYDHDGSGVESIDGFGRNIVEYYKQRQGNVIEYFKSFKNMDRIYDLKLYEFVINEFENHIKRKKTFFRYVLPILNKIN